MAKVNGAAAVLRWIYGQKVRKWILCSILGLLQWLDNVAAAIKSALYRQSKTQLRHSRHFCRNSDCLLHAAMRQGPPP